MSYFSKYKFSGKRIDSTFTVFALVIEEGYSAIKGVLHSLPKNNTFCALSQNYQHLFEKVIYTSYIYSKLSKKLKNGIKI